MTLVQRGRERPGCDIYPTLSRHPGVVLASFGAILLLRAVLNAPWWSVLLAMVYPVWTWLKARGVGIITCPVCQARTLTFGRPVTLCPVCRKAKEDVVGMVGEQIKVYRIPYWRKGGFGYIDVRAVDDAEACRVAWEQVKRERTDKP